jgi:CubicO group peptidase (beta-lactamase class C family)
VKRFCSLSALLLVLAGLAQADHLDDQAAAYMKQRRIPGMVLAVFEHGKIVRESAYGIADLERGVKTTVDSVFEIGSVTKQFTSTMILMLRDEGKLALEDPISKYVDNLPEPWRVVTLKQLLTHTSGVPDFEEHLTYAMYRLEYTPAELIAKTAVFPMDFAPGTDWHYSNTGYYLLGLTLEKVSGKPWGQLLKERILDPLGMTHTRESDPSAVIPNRAAGYERTKDGYINRDAMQPSACKGAGTMVSTVEDMAKWDQELYDCKLLKKSSREESWTPITLPNGNSTGYGYGWFTLAFHGVPSVEHSGGTSGYSCDFMRFPTLGISCMALTNCYATGVGQVCFAALDRYHPGLLWWSMKPSPDPDSKVHDLTLGALKDFAAGGASSPKVDQKAWDKYPATARETWKKRLLTLKKFEFLYHSEFPLRQTEDGVTINQEYVYRLQNAEGYFYLVFYLTPDGKVGQQFREVPLAG